jgi:dTDP-4-amino-4,6-dideoxygalactose transaminase
MWAALVSSPPKTLVQAGDGGAVTTNDAGLAQTMRELAVHGMPQRYLHTALGYNSRLDAIQAAVLNVKLPKLAGWIKNRSTIANRYLERLAELPGIVLPKGDNGHSWNQFVVRVGPCAECFPTLRRGLPNLRHQRYPRPTREPLP